MGSCGGSLFANQWILTAAHCMHEGGEGRLYKPNEISFVINEHKILQRNPADPTDFTFSPNDKYDHSLGRKVLEIGLIIIHEHYDLREPQDPSAPWAINDIALVRLKKPLDLAKYTPVCLPVIDQSSDEVGNTAWVYGWGFFTDDQGTTRRFRSDVLREAAVQVRPDCPRGFLCACGTEGQDDGKGDSGGPLTVQNDGRHVIIGLTSGQSCNGDRTSFYSDVSYYRQWIEDEIDKNSGAGWCDYYI